MTLSVGKEVKMNDKEKNEWYHYKIVAQEVAPGQEYHGGVNEHLEILEVTENLVFFFNDGYSDNKPFRDFVTKKEWEGLVFNKKMELV